MQRPSNNHQLIASAVVGVLGMAAALGIGSLFVRFALPQARPANEFFFLMRVGAGLIVSLLLLVAAWAIILFLAAFVLTVWRHRDYAQICLSGFMHECAMKHVVHSGCRLATYIRSQVR